MNFRLYLERYLVCYQLFSAAAVFVGPTLLRLLQSVLLGDYFLSVWCASQLTGVDIILRWSVGLLSELPTAIQFARMR